MPIKDKAKAAEYQRKYYQRMKQGMSQEQWKELLRKQAEYARTPAGKENARKRVKKWYWNNPERAAQQQAAYRKRRMQWYWDLKRELKCEMCGESHPATLDFHHKDPSTKIFNVSAAASQNIDKEKIMAEIEKCIVVCRNCHAILHYEERNGDNV